MDREINAQQRHGISPAQQTNWVYARRKLSPWNAEQRRSGLLADQLGVREDNQDEARSIASEYQRIERREKTD